MKLTGKLAILLLLAALVFVPLRAAQALEPQEGPIIGSNYTLKSGETLNEDLIVIGGSITIEKGATVTGAIVLIGGSLIVNGEAMGDVVVVGGAASLGSEAHIYGNLVPIGAPVNLAEGARVDGEVINEPVKPSVTVPVVPETPKGPVVDLGDFFSNSFWQVFELFTNSIVLALLASLIVLFLPQQTRRVGEAIPAQPLMMGAMGLLSVIVFVTAMVALGLFSVLIITLIITVPMIIFVAVVFAAAGVFGWVALGTEIGLRLMNTTNREFPLPLVAAVGTFLLNIVANGIGLLPCIGWVMPTLLGLVSLGAVFMTRFGTRPLLITATQAPVESSSLAENV